MTNPGAAPPCGAALCPGTGKRQVQTTRGIEMRVSISANGERGRIEYDEYTRQVMVTFPDRATEKRIQEYLTTERAYLMPESHVLDDYREEKAIPTQSGMHMERALCTLFSRTGVAVDWNDRSE